MATLVVRLPEWLASQSVLGMPVPEGWRRFGFDQGFDDVVFDDEVVVEQDGDVVVDGRWIRAWTDEHDLLEMGRAGGVKFTTGSVRAGDGRPASSFIVVAVSAGRSDPDTVVAADDPTARRRDRPGREFVFAWDLADLRAVEGNLLDWKVRRLEEAGVVVVGRGTNATAVAPWVTVGDGATLWPNTYLLGDCCIGAGAVIHPGCHLTNTVVGAGAVLLPYTVCEGAEIGRGVTVGPFARLREGTVLKEGSKVGNFVETKKTTLGKGAKANHLAYLGDATVGAGSNIGAGTITCNYDGSNKHPTTVGEGVFVGTNSSLVAPLTVGDGALIAAGSVVTDDVPDGALVIGRAKQTTVEDKGAEILARNAERKKKGKG